MIRRFLFVSLGFAFALVALVLLPAHPESLSNLKIGLICGALALAGGLLVGWNTAALFLGKP